MYRVPKVTLKIARENSKLLKIKPEMYYQFSSQEKLSIPKHIQNTQ